MQTTIGSITPRAIQQAYKSTGWKPITQAWVQAKGGKMCGCALTVFVKHKTGTLPDSQTPQGYANFLGVTHEQVTAFTSGYDGFLYEGEEKPWHDLGVASRKAVFARAFIEG